MCVDLSVIFGQRKLRATLNVMQIKCEKAYNFTIHLLNSQITVQINNKFSGQRQQKTCCSFKSRIRSMVTYVEFVPCFIFASFLLRVWILHRKTKPKSNSTFGSIIGVYDVFFFIASRFGTSKRTDFSRIRFQSKYQQRYDAFETF